jgi:hypothetical protein
MVSDPARVALRVVVVALVPITIGCARLAPGLLARAEWRAAAQKPATASSTESLPPRLLEPGRDDDENEGDVDLYGNDVTDAVAKYKLDSDGSLYELHSPQTQLPRLESPKG